jgi:hypothetical protein
MITFVLVTGTKMILRDLVSQSEHEALGRSDEGRF